MGEMVGERREDWGVNGMKEGFTASSVVHCLTSFFSSSSEREYMSSSNESIPFARPCDKGRPIPT